MNPSMSSFSSATTIFGGLPARRGEQDLPLTSNNRLQQTALRRAARRNKALDRTVHDELCTTDCARWATQAGACSARRARRSAPRFGRRRVELW